MTELTADHDAAVRSNLALWNEWTDIHARSDFYDLEGFRRGERRLHPLEIEELGDVRGKTLLHLQCHFGLDTLSWASRGATVTGADFSDRAVALARALSADLDIPARFILSGVYDLPAVLDERFDIVFTSYGAICWLPDIRRWAETAAALLRSGGTFYMAEFHPFSQIFDDERAESDLRVRYTYFHSPVPLTFPVQGSYADPTAEVRTGIEHVWNHTIGDVVSALAGAGLRIEYLHEHAFSVYRQLTCMPEQPDADGYWRLPENGDSVPLMFSIRATKP